MNTLKKLIDKVTEFFEGVAERKIPTYSAAATYYLFMSLVPMVMLLVSLVQYTPLTQEVVMDTIENYIPYAMYEVVAQIVSTVFNGGRTALTISILLTIWSASASMKALMRGMDAVYNVERREHIVLFYLRACLYMIIFVVVILLSLIIMVYGGSILDLVRGMLPHSEALDYIFNLARYMRFLVTMAVLTLVFMVLYRWMPSAKLKYRFQWAGAVFTSVSWVLFSWIFSFYVSVSNKFGAYGLLGTVIVAMMWMRYCMYFLLLGGYINCHMDARRAVRRRHNQVSVHQRKKKEPPENP